MSEALLPQKIEDFGFPVTLAFARDERVYLSERMTGRLWRIDHEDYRLIHTFPIVPLLGHHETGLLGIALDPEFETNGFIYCYYTYGTSQKDMKNRVVRVNADRPEEQLLLDGIPAGMIHNGGVLAFAPDNSLFIGTGVDNGVKDQAQDTQTLNGKILRINRDGNIPADNPFPNSPVFAYGLRNVFGLAIHPATGKLYAGDVGPEKNDEINIIEKGGNYGWPLVTGKSDDSRFINPLRVYEKVITPTQAVFVGNDLYFGSYNEGSVHKLTLSGDNFDGVETDEIVYRGKPYSVNGVFYGSDTLFYVTTANAIERIEPKTEGVLEKIPGAETITQGVEYPKKLIQGRLQKPAQSVDELGPDKGAVVEYDGKKVAAYKSADNKLLTLSPVCTHMGCIVEWNGDEKTWDCPCHGSRFEKEGQVKQGPAEKDLEKLPIQAG